MVDFKCVTGFALLHQIEITQAPIKEFVSLHKEFRKKYQFSLEDNNFDPQAANDPGDNFNLRQTTKECVNGAENAALAEHLLMSLSNDAKI